MADASARAQFVVAVLGQNVTGRLATPADTPSPQAGDSSPLGRVIETHHCDVAMGSTYTLRLVALLRTIDIDTHPEYTFTPTPYCI